MLASTVVPAPALEIERWSMLKPSPMTRVLAWTSWLLSWARVEGTKEAHRSRGRVGGTVWW